jgi:hypothetical protein
MVPIIYTDTDQIRSVLGISRKDLSDEQLVSRNLEKELQLDLSSWVPNHALIYSSANSGAATDIQQNMADSITLYSTYYCAKLVLTTLQMGLKKSISDGKNALNRFDTVDWDKLYDRMSERVTFYRQYVTANNQTISSVAPVSRVMFSIVGSSRDPVTG